VTCDTCGASAWLHTNRFPYSKCTHLSFLSVFRYKMLLIIILTVNADVWRTLPHNLTLIEPPDWLQHTYPAWKEKKDYYCTNLVRFSVLWASGTVIMTYYTIGISGLKPLCGYFIPSFSKKTAHYAIKYSCAYSPFTWRSLLLVCVGHVTLSSDPFVLFPPIDHQRAEKCAVSFACVHACCVNATFLLKLLCICLSSRSVNNMSYAFFLQTKQWQDE
jgi:hypothetical protein